MKKPHLIGALCAVVFAVISMSSHAVAALEGRLPATPGGTDYQAYYDPDANLTWLANANAAKGSAYDIFRPGSGLMIWADANAWAAGLNINCVTGWRLPTTLQPDSSCEFQLEASYGSRCSGSEMGNLFYNVLGGVGGAIRGVDGGYIRTTYNSNYDLFSNVYEQNFWTSTEFALNPAKAFTFNLGRNAGGLQDIYSKTFLNNAWAVHSGDVGARIKPPSTAWQRARFPLCMGNP